MLKHATADLTLPSVVAISSAAARRQALVLTIIFHPDTSRIGETARFEKVAGEDVWLLGRRVPEFSSKVSATGGRGLEDSYISRVALQFSACKGELIMQRPDNSSRCCVLGKEIGTQSTITKSQLRSGVAIQLGGRVVLLLRKSTLVESHSERSDGEKLLGSSAYMCQLRAQIARLATSGLDVLIRGETGTGKELVAGAMHKASKRSNNDMIAVNMAAIPEALAPAALFGSARGAFTGAEKSTPGYFEQADGSTLFLDEIGDTPPEVQAQLLRALQQREIQCVGGPIKSVDIRVISATDAELTGDQCSFKAALRYRLAQSELELAPLRDHPEDIGELLWQFVASDLRSMGRTRLLPEYLPSPANIAQWADLFHIFLLYRWPGNVRQLINFCSQVAVASESALKIPETVHKSLLNNLPKAQELDPEILEPRPYSDREFMESFAKARYEVTRVAKELGLSRQAVYRRISQMPDLCLANEVSGDQLKTALRDSDGDQALAAWQLKVSLAGLRERIRNTPQTGTS